MAHNAGPFAQLRAWLARRGQVRPVVLRPTLGPTSDRALGMVPVGAPVMNDPSSGLYQVNALAADAGRVAPGLTSDLVKIDQSAWGRPGRHNIAYSLSSTTGDARVMGAIENDGRRTVLARPSIPGRSVPAAPAPTPWRGADFRTAPQGALGALVRTEYGSAGAGGGRTRFRLVPPTDAANPAPK